MNTQETTNTRLNHLDNKVATMGVSLDNLTSNVSKLTVSVETIALNLNNSSKTNWGTLFTCIGVLVAVMSSFAYMASKPYDLAITDLKQENKELRIQNKENNDMIRDTQIQLAKYEENNALLRGSKTPN